MQHFFHIAVLFGLFFMSPFVPLPTGVAEVVHFSQLSFIINHLSIRFCYLLQLFILLAITFTHLSILLATNFNHLAIIQLVLTHS